MKVILQIVHDLLITYQKLQWPGEPDEGVARVILAVEQELQGITSPSSNKSNCCAYWWSCPTFRRVEALESLVKKYLTPNPYPGDRIGGG